MRCKNVRQWLVVQARNPPLPTGIAEHISRCAECRLFQEQDLQVRQLIGLKQYESPPFGSEERTVRAVHAIMEEQWHGHPAGQPQRFWDFLFIEPVPAFRYAAAVLLLVLVSVHMLKMPQLGSPESSAYELQVVETTTPASEPATATAFSIPDKAPQILPEFQVVSNRSGGFMEYGPGRSIPVSFDY